MSVRGTEESNSSASGMADYLRAFLGFDPSAIRRAALLNFAAAIMEGTGLMLLLPLLALAGVLGAGEGRIMPLDRAFSMLGFKWNIQTALCVFIALVSVQSLLAMLRDREANSLQMRFGDHLRKQLYAAIAHSKWSFFTCRHSGEFVSVLTTEVQRVVAGTYFLLRLFTMLVLGLAYLVVALRLSVWLTLLALATGLLLWAVLRGADSAAKQGGILLSEANRLLYGLIQEFLSSMKLVKLHGEEDASLRSYNLGLDRVSERSIEFQRVRTRVQAVYRVGGAVALSFVSYAALVWFELPAANLLVMVAIFARMLPQLAELQNGRQQLLHMLPAFLAWRKLLDACAANVDPVASCGDPVPLVQGIAFERVEFSRPYHRLVVDKLFIPARKTTAIIGDSGSGKTTLIDLLSGLLAPDHGVIRIDGVPLQQLPGWRQSIASIPQESQIQHGTLRDNLIWGNVVTQDVEIETALSQSALAEWVLRLPDGLETEVGERGVRLSGGEKQRLALARALLRRPQLLVLDEATSALDADNHRMVIDAIRALHGRTTVLIVTHRMEELSGMIDGVVKVDQGEARAWQPIMA